MLLFIRCCFLVFSLKSSISKHLMLLFIINITFWCICISYISKHLMLLFIFKASCNSQHFSAFQNILCYCLSKSHLDRYVTDYISKHLMLLFIFIFFPAATLPSSISKHLMLLFIRRRTLNRFTTDISKHLMLLFIPYPAFIILTEL